MNITRLDRLARFGYFTRAAVYALFGYLALTASSQARKGPRGGFVFLQSVPGGKIILLILASGLLAYGAYKLGSALFDGDRDGSDLKGVGKRIGRASGGAAYLTMCWAALRGAAGIAAGSQASGKEAAAATLQFPLGGIALGLAGIGFFVFAGFQLRNAATRHFMRALQPDAPAFTCTVGRIGLSARAFVFAVVGQSLLRGAWRGRQDQVRDVGGALASLRENHLLYICVAAGLTVFAFYSAIEGRYRIVPRIDPVKAGKRMVKPSAAV